MLNGPKPPPPAPVWRVAPLSPACSPPRLPTLCPSPQPSTSATPEGAVKNQYISDNPAGAGASPEEPAEAANSQGLTKKFSSGKDTKSIHFRYKAPRGGTPSYSYSYSSPSTVPVPLRLPRSIGGRTSPEAVPQCQSGKEKTISKPYHFHIRPPRGVPPTPTPARLDHCNVVPLQKEPHGTSPEGPVQNPYNTYAKTRLL
jgi:hypothetical protein